MDKQTIKELELSTKESAAANVIESECFLAVTLSKDSKEYELNAMASKDRLIDMIMTTIIDQDLTYIISQCLQSNELTNSLGRFSHE